MVSTLFKQLYDMSLLLGLKMQIQLSKLILRCTVEDLVQTSGTRFTALHFLHNLRVLLVS